MRSTNTSCTVQVFTPTKNQVRVLSIWHNFAWFWILVTIMLTILWSQVLMDPSSSLNIGCWWNRQIDDSPSLGGEFRILQAVHGLSVLIHFLAQGSIMVFSLQLVVLSRSNKFCLDIPTRRICTSGENKFTSILQVYKHLLTYTKNWDKTWKKIILSHCKCFWSVEGLR